MAKFKIIRWDDSNFISKLLDSTETAMINNLDVSGSSGVMTIASGSATGLVLGVAGMPIILSRKHSI